MSLTFVLIHNNFFSIVPHWKSSHSSVKKSRGEGYWLVWFFADTGVSLFTFVIDFNWSEENSFKSDKKMSRLKFSRQRVSNNDGGSHVAMYALHDSFLELISLEAVARSVAVGTYRASHLVTSSNDLFYQTSVRMISWFLKMNHSGICMLQRLANYNCKQAGYHYH